MTRYRKSLRDLLTDARNAWRSFADDRWARRNPPIPRDVRACGWDEQGEYREKAER